MTLQEHWRSYRDACYPEGIPAAQNIETHQAFFSGAMIALLEAVRISGNESLSDDRGAQAIGDLLKEACDVVQQRVELLKARH